MVTFEHTPLPADNEAFRLMRINGIDIEGAVDCSVFQASLESASYIALSYLWGSDAASYTIHLNGRQLLVRHNLWTFLVQTYAQLKGKNIWIDAICIDQADTEEKNKQVPLMRRIFNQATEVVSWLDVHTMPDLSHETNIAAANLIMRLLKDPNSSRSRDTIQVAGALVRLLSHDYWSRIWIIQELALAEQNCMIWGLCTFKRTEVASLCESLGDNENLRAQRLLQMMCSIRKDLLELPIFDIFPARKMGSVLPTNELLQGGPDKEQSSLVGMGWGTNLIDLVLRYAHHSCTLAIDRVFGLLALATDNRHFLPNYQETTFELLVRMVMWYRIQEQITYWKLASALRVADDVEGFTVLANARMKSAPDFSITEHRLWPLKWKLANINSSDKPWQSATTKSMVIAGIPTAGIFIGFTCEPSLSPGQSDRSMLSHVFDPSMFEDFKIESGASCYISSKRTTMSLEVTRTAHEAYFDTGASGGIVFLPDPGAMIVVQFKLIWDKSALTRIGADMPGEWMTVFRFLQQHL